MAAAEEKKDDGPKATMILMIFTNVSTMGEGGKQTGWYLPEAAHPYEIFKEAGLEVVFASGKGGACEADLGSITEYESKDDACKNFMSTFVTKEELNGILKCTVDTKAITGLNIASYKGIFYVGGHGTMWDFKEDSFLRAAAERIYLRQSGVIGAVCHGPAGLLSLKATEGGAADSDSLIKGKKVVGFTNTEEAAMKLTEVVPYSLEDEMVKCGGVFSGGADWADVSVRDGRLVTGQNPASAGSCAKLFIEALSECDGKPVGKST